VFCWFLFPLPGQAVWFPADYPTRVERAGGYLPPGPRRSSPVQDVYTCRMEGNMEDQKYPLRVLSLGAGVQSTTLLRMIIHGELPPVDHAIFSDTGWEPQAVYQHLEVLKKECEDAGIPLHIVSNGNIRDDALNPDKRFASMPVHLRNGKGDAILRRQCTAEYKIKPLIAKQRELAGLKPGQRCKEHRITTIIGISWDEMQRMKPPAFSWIVNEYPLVDNYIKRHDCIRWNEEHGYPPPPRSSCIGCPYHNNHEWRAVRDDPDAWADAIDFDNQLRSGRLGDLLAPSEAFLHSQRVPLAEADLRTEEDKGQGNLFDMECEGMCGI